MKLDHDAIIDKLRAVPRLIFADDYEVAVQYCTAESSQFLNGDLQEHTTEESSWLSLRLHHQRRPGRASTPFLGEESLPQLVAAAFESSRHASPDPWFRFPIWRNSIPSVPSSRTEPDSAESRYSKLEWRPEQLSERYENWEISTSLFRKTERKTLRQAHRIEGITLSATHSSDGNRWRLLQRRLAPQGRLDPERSIDETLRALYYRKSARLFQRSDDETIVLGPQAVRVILKYLSDWFCAAEVQKGVSPLSERLGSSIFSDAVTIVDDPHHERSVFQGSHDLEGSLTQKTVLVEKGHLRGLLYDVYSAARENRLSTGNWFRSLGAENPTIAPWHLVLQNGESSLDQLFAKAGTGVFIDYLSKLVPDPERPASVVVTGSGWRVTGGALDHALWQIRFKFDIFDLMQRVTSVGRTSTFFGDVAAPAVLIDSLPITE